MINPVRRGNARLPLAGLPLAGLLLAVLLAAFFVFGVNSAAAYRKLLSSAKKSEAFVESYYEYASFVPGDEDIAARLEFPGGLLWKAGETDSVIQCTLEVPEAGLYTLWAEYVPQNESYERNLFDLSVNGVENANIVLPSFYRFSTYDFVKNSRGNDIYPGQLPLRQRQRLSLRPGEQTGSTDRLLLSLRAGANHFSLGMNEGAALLYALGLQKAGPPPPTYAEYRAARPGGGVAIAPETFFIEGEKFYYKNKSSIAVVNNPEYTVSPYSTQAVELNVIDPKTYKEHLDTLAYLVEISQAGYYTIGIKAAMPGKTDSPVFLDIEIDGEIPFAEFRELRLDFQRFMYNHSLADFPVYLEKGVHELAFVLNGARYQGASARLKTIAGEISDLSVALRKITGNNQDRNREWIIADFLPDMVPSMERWKKDLEETEAELLLLSRGKSTEEINKIRVALKQLQKLIDEPNKVPYRLTVLSEGERSILQTLSQAFLTVTSQSLELDQIILGQAQRAVTRNVFFGLSETAAQLVSSYREKPASRTDPQAIDVWVLRSRQYADVLQSLCDEQFTPASGIRVNFSLITDQGKLTLANAAGRQPDAALGVDQHYVNDLALRGSLTDLRRLPDANSAIKNAAPGALLQMIIDDKLYGLPESQDMSLLFYRSDIFSAFGWKVPETWDEVLLMLPALARNGMNFYLPLAQASSFKDWRATIPFYTQAGARIYSDDGRGTVIDSDEGVGAMRFMTGLFTMYGMPLQVANFYNDFRSGRIPIGVADMGEYSRIAFSAPEIAGRWGVTMIPGMKNKNGEVEHWSSCASKADCIFEDSPKKEAAWAFIRWWLSEETQRTYMEKMQNMYGQEFLWISGNVEVLKKLPVPEPHREQIAGQIAWLQDAPRIPGGYYTEREVSNAFNRIIYDGMDVRSSVDEASVVTNREIRRKMEEFGYIDSSGAVIREYLIPTIDGVLRWLEEGL
ncbi:ABC transporter substrate-binding protein [Spirochaetia bacterium]|nr:ABC transporter substrate-binding protein [Spirochaetia bacterium]